MAVRFGSNRKSAGAVHFFLLYQSNTKRSQVNSYKTIPLIESDDEARDIETDGDVARSSGLDIAGYILKPFDYEQFIEAMKILDIHRALSGIENN